MKNSAESESMEIDSDVLSEGAASRGGANLGFEGDNIVTFHEATPNLPVLRVLDSGNRPLEVLPGNTAPLAFASYVAKHISWRRNAGCVAR
jgi:hypothetical protein